LKSLAQSSIPSCRMLAKQPALPLHYWEEV
jgi:hypothetical protein